MNAAIKKISTPLTIVSSTVVALSGTLMFFHLAHDLLKAAHEWIGMLFVAAMLLHIINHWRSFKNYFSQKQAISIFATVVLASTLFVVNSPSGEHPAIKLVHQFEQKTLLEVANFQQRPLEQILIDFEVERIEVNSSEQTLNQIAESNNTDPMRLLGILMKQAG